MTLPPLLAMAAGRKTRPRKAPVIRPKEQVLHFATAKLLREHCRPHWQWTHVGHGEARDINTAAKLKRKGLRPGWPDFVLVPPTGQMHCLELKRQGEGLSDDQDAFRIWCIKHGLPHSVCRTFNEVLAVLDAWGCLTITLPRRDRNRGRP